jgi:nucleotide-binding universal stress UspA family protein
MDVAPEISSDFSDSSASPRSACSLHVDTGRTGLRSAMTIFKRILFATDFGESATEALPYAAALATASDAELHLLHVLDPLEPPWRSRVSATSRANVVDAWVRDATRSLTRLSARYGRRPRTACRVGRPAAAIVDYAREMDADLIVLGSPGSGVVRHIGGSVAEGVVRFAPCPVLTVRQSKPAGLGFAARAVSNVWADVPAR